MPALTIDELSTLIRDGVPLVGSMGVSVDSLGDGIIRLTLPYRPDFVRPGGTVMGPALFALADVALYGAVLSLIGRVELAVTTSIIRQQLCYCFKRVFRLHRVIECY